jgi:[ribosomal protein S5]-alanine N-acetyltransferase
MNTAAMTVGLKRPLPAPIRQGAGRSRASPTIATRHLRLRPFELRDISPLVDTVATHRISDTTLAVPHPFSTLQARHWIESHRDQWEARRAVHWAVSSLADEQLSGYVGLQEVDQHSGSAELSFWISERLARRNLAIDAAQAVLAFAFTTLHLQRVEALQLTDCQLVGRVLLRIGMQAQSPLCISRWGRSEEVVPWSVDYSDWVDSLLIRTSRRR